MGDGVSMPNTAWQRQVQEQHDLSIKNAEELKAKYMTLPLNCSTTSEYNAANSACEELLNDFYNNPTLGESAWNIAYELKNRRNLIHQKMDQQKKGEIGDTIHFNQPLKPE